MPLTLNVEEFAAIRTRIMRRKIEAVAMEIDAATEWNDQCRFSDVDDLLKFLDAVAEEAENPSQRSSQRR